MKPNSLAMTMLLSASLIADAQTDTQSASAMLDSPTKDVPPANYSVVERGTHFRRWQNVTPMLNPSGQTIFNTNLYTELQDGLCYRDPVTGQWTDASDQIVIQPDGGALADKGQCRLYFPGSLYSDALQCRAGDGATLTSRPVGLLLDDGGRSVLIAKLRDGPVGQLLPSGSAVIYTNILDSLHCDLLVEYKRSGYEASLIIRESFDPAAWGFTDPENVRVRWLTEFINPPTPTVQQTAMPNGMVDELLDFGEVQMGNGQGFLLGSTPEASTRVCKQWLNLDPGSRTILSEEIQWTSISQQIQRLPPHTASTSPGSAEPTTSEFGLLPLLPVSRPVSHNTNSIEVAESDYQNTAGYLIDYNLGTSYSNFTFKGGPDDGTYYCSGTVTLSGTTTIEANAVIKFTNSSSAKLVVKGQVKCITGPFRMAILTSKDDDSVGTTIAGSTHSPNNNNGGTYISSSITGYPTYTNSYRYLRFSYAGVGLNLLDNSKNDVWHSQFVRCAVAIKWCDDCSGSFYGINNCASSAKSVGELIGLGEFS